MAYRQTQDSMNSDPAKVGTQYSVRNPHPGWNPDNPEEPFDPNIANEYGHTKYPKWVSHPFLKEVQVSHTSSNIGGGQTRIDRHEHKVDAKGKEFPKQVLVHSKEEEDALMVLKEGEDAPAKKQTSWKK